MSRDELSLKIESDPDLVEKLGEFVGPTNLDGMTEPIEEVFYYNSLRSQFNPENPEETPRHYVVYAKRNYSKKTVITIRQTYEGYSTPTIEDLPLVHEFQVGEGWPYGIFPDKVRYDDVCMVYTYRSKTMPGMSTEIPVPFDVYERFKQLFDELPWEEER